MDVKGQQPLSPRHFSRLVFEDLLRVGRQVLGARCGVIEDVDLDAPVLDSADTGGLSLEPRMVAPHRNVISVYFREDQLAACGKSR